MLQPVVSARRYFGGAHSIMATCSSSGDLADEINDPGAAPYGNFINYYTFNPPENRLSLIPTTLLQDLGYSVDHQTTLILDVGCNSGVCRRRTLSRNGFKMSPDSLHSNLNIM